MDQENGNRRNTDGNIWDMIFKTLLQEMPQMVLPLINEAFHENYAMNAQIISLNNEFYNADGSKVVSDTSFQVKHKLYHFECQFSNGMEMAFRMFEYDFHIALSDAKRKNRLDEFVFPKSCVVYITSNQNNPKRLRMTIKLPTDDKTDKMQKFIYEVPTVRVHDYTLENISKKKLLIFLPYLVLRYPQKLKTKNPPTIGEIKHFFNEMIGVLQSAYNEKVIGTPQYNVLLELIKKAEEHVFHDYSEIKKEVDPMVANLLNLQSVKMKRELEQQTRELELQTRELEQQRKATKQAAEQASLSSIEMIKQFGITLTEEQIQAILKHAVEQQN